MLYPADLIISIASQFSSWAHPQIWIDGDWVVLCSDKMKTFRSSLICVSCGLRGEYFVKERHRNTITDQRFHFSLYGSYKGVEIEFTSDHKVPVSRGGSKRGLENRQTLCYHCNQIKSDSNISLSELRNTIIKSFKNSIVSERVIAKLTEGKGKINNEQENRV